MNTSGVMNSNEQQFYSMFLYPKQTDEEKQMDKHDYQQKEQSENHRYQPPRYEVMDSYNIEPYNTKKVLSNLQSRVGELEWEKQPLNQTNKSKKLQSIRPIKEKVEKCVVFKKKAIKRMDNEMNTFQEIFVSPKQEMLENIDSQRGSQYSVQIEQTKQQQQYYQNLLLKHDKKKREQHRQELEHKRSLMSQSSMRMSQDDIYQQDEEEQIIQYEKQEQNEENQQIFDQPILISPPDLNNLNDFSLRNKYLKNGLARSIPVVTSLKDKKINQINELLMKNKAGMHAGDVQKEAHLTFILAMVNEENKNYQEAIKYFMKFQQIANQLEDKIGESLSLNRISINYYWLQDYENFINFNQQHLETSDQENLFASYYNMGIAFRKLQHYQKAIEYFQAANEWANQREELESKCLCIGQLGLCYYGIDNLDMALNYLKACYDLSIKIKNNKLKLDCLLNIIPISSQSHEYQNKIFNILKDAYSCAKNINDKKTMILCLCNMGINTANNQFHENKEKLNIPNDDLF